uniref:Miltiradiene/abietatriene hydroxylase n=1 Tax=Callicarpa americana TaxID=204211 RepID=A0A977LLP9_CALAM|nr:miltiradiene/abietatriene hydroxylase [Callicarpa americana]
MDFFAFFIVLLFVVWATWFHFLRQRSGAAKLPPGPYPLPIIGNILQLSKTPHQSLAKLSKTYGPLMSLHLGSMYTIVVSSPEIAKEILQKHDQAFSSRTIPAAAQAHDHDKVSMAYLPVGNEWRKIRKICREQMFSTHRLEESQVLRQEKLQKLSDYLQKSCDRGRVVNIAEATFITTLNLMSATLFSIQVTDFDSDATQEFKKTFEDLTNIVAVPNFGDFFPFLKPMDLQGIQRKSEFYFGKMLGFIDDLINQRLQSRGASSLKKNDLLETLLDLSQGSEYEFISIKVIKHMFLDLLFAGSDTTASTAEWAMTELLLNPEKMSKAKHELRTVIGENKQVQESDISRLPYFQAVIKEVLRCHPPAPLLIPHKSDYDVQIRGYMIPKETQILVNVWALGREPSVWSNPNSFEPERFLDRKIDFRGQDFEFIPFGSGRRICPGLPLADRMLPIMVATLIHNFDWKLEPGVKPEQVDTTEKFGQALHKAVPLRAIPIKP